MELKNIILNIFKSLLTSAAFLLTDLLTYNNKVTDFVILLVWNAILFLIYSNLKKYKSKAIVVLSFLFSIFMILGYSYTMINSSELVFGSFNSIVCSLLSFLGYFVFFSAVLQICFDLLKHVKFKEQVKNSKNKFINVFNKHPFLISLIIILLCWLPYIISFYPAILSRDPSFQIKQFYNIPNKYSDYVVLLDENVILTNHHPVVHTLLLGGCTKLGLLLGSFNLGLFIYSLIQIMLLSSVLAYTISYMNKLKISYWIQLGSLLIYSLVPSFPFYAMSAVKDVIFSSLVMLFIVILYDFIKNANNKRLSLKNKLFIGLLMLLIALFRNNGIYVVLLSFPLLLFIKNKHKISLLLIILCTISIYFGYEKVLLPTLKITPGSIREMLSIPFQQTARYVLEYRDQLSSEDAKAIDKVLNINTLAERYTPQTADPVKNEYNRYTTKAELFNYFKVWFKGLLKHPGVYIDATINNTYGYFYPPATSWYIYYRFNDIITADCFDYHYNNLSKLRDKLATTGEEYQKLPVIGLTSHIGFNTWLLMIMTGYLIHIKKYKYIIFLMPALISLLVCVASPVNTYYRYALPFIFGMPVMIGLFIDAKRRD